MYLAERGSLPRSKEVESMEIIHAFFYMYLHIQIEKTITVLNNTSHLQSSRDNVDRT